MQAHPLFKDHRTIKGFVVRLADPGRKKRAEGQQQKAIIRIVSVGSEVHRLHLLAQEFERTTGFSLPYFGEEMPSLVKRLADEHIYWRRSNIPKEARAQLQSRQGDKCNLCGDTLVGGEVHHVARVADHIAKLEDDARGEATWLARGIINVLKEALRAREDSLSHRVATLVATHVEEGPEVAKPTFVSPMSVP